jgi:Response receiver domain
MPTENYETFIDEAFIKPIRSVLIVDDDYPTFEELLSEGEPSSKDWRKNRDRVRNVIASLRGKDRNLLVDIHDGANVGLKGEIDTATHLHQSDLLVLDFQLDKTKLHDGSIAVKIIRRLMTNPHFNLVVVHTSENLDYVFSQVVLGMLPPDNCVLTQADTDKAEELIAARDDADTGFEARLVHSVAATQYLEVRRLGLGKCFRLAVKGAVPFAEFHTVCQSARWGVEDLKLVFQHSVARASKALMKFEPEPGLPEISWSSGNVKWVRTQSVFVAFANKFEDEPPMTELSQALADWRPDPSRLYLARLRHEIDDGGTPEQASVLGNTHALAGWYDRMLKADPEATRQQIEQTVVRLSESFMGPVTDKVVDFAERMISFERKGGDAAEICEKHFGVNLKTEDSRLIALGQHNSVVSTKRREGWHLTTGHIFSCKDSYWVCASPACDMVPSQLSPFKKTSYPGCMPFTAIRLQPVPKLKTAVEMANSTRVLFVEIEEELTAFCFNDAGDDASAPQWTLLFAEGDGRFTEGTFDFNLVHMGAGEAGLTAIRQTATVVSQLRYEYALNLVQRLGVSMTRIGLDFQAVPKEKRGAQLDKKDAQPTPAAGGAPGATEDEHTQTGPLAS